MTKLFSLKRKALLTSRLLVAAGLTLISANTLAETAQQTVNYSVIAIKAITVTGTPATLAIDSATAGSALDAKSDATTSWAVTTNASGANTTKVTAQLDSNMPSGLTLTVSLAAPTGGVTNGTGDVTKTLSTTVQDVVTGMQGVSDSDMAITYNLSADLTAVAVSASKIVTYTVVDA